VDLCDECQGHADRRAAAVSGFTGIAWVALAGQVLLAVAAATVVRWRDGQPIA